MKIAICGDVVPKPISEKYFIDGNVEKLFDDVLPLMRGADRTIVNLECALTKSDNAIPKCGPNLKADPACAVALKKAGVTDVALSNNHTFDFGADGLIDTVNAVKSAGLCYTGVGDDDTLSRKIHYMKDGKTTVAVVNVCEHEYSYALADRIGANPFDPFVTMRDIRTAKQNSDFVLVLYHGGKEHCRYPSPRLRELSREMIHNGANAIIMQHSHCIGCYENYDNAHVLYGQGNFHFMYEGRDDMWNTGLLVELDTTENSIKFYPLRAKPPTLSLAKGDDAEELMSEFYKRNEELKDGRWLCGWREFCEKMSEQYLGALRNYSDESDPKAKEIVAHYLDCEAHTDVWRELLKTRHLQDDKIKTGKLE